MFKQKIKKLVFTLAGIISYPYRVVPFFIREKIYTLFFILESQAGSSKSGLKNLFLLSDKMDRVINEVSVNYDERGHPKHRLMNYHNFFIENISEGMSVLDIGCGVGKVAASIAASDPSLKVFGIDLDLSKIAIAKNNTQHLNNVSFFCGDALRELPNKKIDVVVLSNVLEHIEDRINFLKDIVKKYAPKKLLIRVPMFERHWHIPLRKELGINYYSDNTHFIEHTAKEFDHEIESACLMMITKQNIWGEIWSICQPIEQTIQA